MNTFINIILLIISFIFVVWGGNKFVDHSVILAKKLKMPSAIVGATIVSLGTTLPELLVTVLSSTNNQSELAVGNALGSIIFNSCIIGGVLLFFTKNKLISSKISPSLLLISCLFFSIMCINGKLDIWESIILIILFFIFIFFNIKTTKNKIEQNQSNQKNAKLPVIILMLIFSATIIAVGANTLINSASNLSRILGLSETVIGLTIISFGTSLPELITSIIALTKKESDLGLGNIIGSNIINLLLLIGISGAINSPLLLSPQTLAVGVPFSLIATLLLCVPLIIFTKQKKPQALFLLATFASYYLFLIFY